MLSMRYSEEADYRHEAHAKGERRFVLNGS